MDAIWRVGLRAARRMVAWGLLAGLMASCGGSGGPDADVPADDASLAVADSEAAQTVLIPVPAERRSAQTAPQETTFRVHYHRLAADYDGWQIHTWGAAQDPGWNNG